MDSHTSDIASAPPRRGSLYLGRGRWVSIPVGSPRRPLTEPEIREAHEILDRAEEGSS